MFYFLANYSAKKMFKEQPECAELGCTVCSLRSTDKQVFPPQPVYNWNSQMQFSGLTV